MFNCLLLVDLEEQSTYGRPPDFMMEPSAQERRSMQHTIDHRTTRGRARGGRGKQVFPGTNLLIPVLVSTYAIGVFDRKRLLYRNIFLWLNVYRARVQKRLKIENYSFIVFS